MIILSGVLCEIALYVVTVEDVYELVCCESYGGISLTFGDLERSDQGHLLKTWFLCEIAL